MYWFVKSPAGAANLAAKARANFSSRSRPASLHLIGLTYATLIRNEGWWFTQAGKFIERADKTSRILDVRSQTAAGAGRARGR